MGLSIEEQRIKLREKGEVTKLLKRTRSPKQIDHYKKKKKKKEKQGKPKFKKKPRRKLANPYKTKAWFDLRAIALTRDGFMCQKCGNKKNLHVHHLSYNTTGVNKLIVPIDKLLTVCKPCHQVIHGREF